MAFLSTQVRTLATIALLSVWPAMVAAQDVQQNFLAPRAGTGTRVDPYRPAGTDSLPEGTEWLSYSWGGEPWFLVRVEAPTMALQGYAGTPGVTAFPQDLSTVVTVGQLDPLVVVLTAARIPSAWVVRAMSWAAVLNTLWDLCSLAQRISGLSNQVYLSMPAVEDGTTRWRDVPTDYRQRLEEAADSLGMVRTGIADLTRLGDVLTDVAVTYPQGPWGE